MTTFLTVFGLILTCVNYEIILDKYKPSELNINNRDHYLNNETAMESKRFKDPINLHFRWLVLFMSVGSALTMIMRHYFKVMWLKRYFNKSKGNQDDLYIYYNQIITGGFDGKTTAFNSDSQNLLENNKLYQKTLVNRFFFLEILMLLICPLPFYEHYIMVEYDVENGDGGTFDLKCNYFVSDFILAFMFLRFIFMIRAVINYSIYTDAYSKKLCLSYGFTSNVRFAIKCHLSMSPTLTVFTLFGFVVFVIAYVLRIFELPFYFSDIADATGL